VSAAVEDAPDLAVDVAEEWLGGEKVAVGDQHGPEVLHLPGVHIRQAGATAQRVVDDPVQLLELVCHCTRR
jgi:hypothetical protein